MSRKIYAAVLPLLSVVVFAAMPATSQAAFHWYKCEPKASGKYHDPDCTEKTGTTFELTRLPFEKEGVLTKTEVSSFGKLTLTVKGPPELVVKCNVLDEGNIWNVTEATAGKDEVTAFINKKCTSPTCTGTVTIEPVAASLPWLTELVAGPKDKIAGIEIKLTCTSPSLSETFKGTLEPTVVNGSPSYLDFEGATSGHLTGSTLGEATVKGKDFIAETETADNIDVVNP
jgi:hypothetical protein